MADNKNNKAKTLSIWKRVAWSTLFMTLFIAVSLAVVWFTSLKTHIVIASISILFAALFIFVLSFWLLSREKKEKKKVNKDEIELLNKRKSLLALHFKKMLNQQKRKRRLTSRYDQPIYLLLTSDINQDKSIITQMGYEAYKVDDFGNDIEFPILFWLSDHSIIVSISLAEDQHPEYLKTICQSLNKWRPRQAVNGVICTTDINKVVDTKENIQQYADMVRGQIKAFNNAFGLKLPIYNVLTNMGSISDFCQFFSSFDESKRNEALGATIPYQKHGGIDADWFTEEYDRLISQLIANTSSALSGQLNQEYRNAIASAPFQFGLLKQNLWVLLSSLYRGEQLQDALLFRGFYFTHQGGTHEKHDLLASVINHSLGSESYVAHSTLPVHHTLFAGQLMNQVILSEHQIVGVNKRKENGLLFGQVAYTTVCALILLATLIVIKLDFDYQSERETRADNMLERYKEAIAAAPYDIENMADNIPNLYSLHSIYALYLKPEPWYTLSFMPSSSIKHEVEAAYINELEQVLIPSMENTLEKDLFIYVTLEDQAKTLSLLNNYRLLFNENRTNIEELKSYFITTLQDQGQADSINTTQLKVLLDDVFDRDLVPVKANYDLESLAKKVINQTGVEALLYDHIMNSHTYSSRVDVRDLLGTQFDDLFAFSSQYVGYLVPYLYTPQGFRELDLSVNSGVIQEALTAYEGVAGTTPSALEMYQISRDLKQTYQNDYINYWRTFASNVKMKPIADPNSLNRSLNILSGATNNPLYNLYSVISKNTSLELAVPEDPQTDEEKAVAELAMNQSSDVKEMARQVTLAFSNYHKLLENDAQNGRPIDTLLASYGDTKVWLDQFYESEEPQKLAYQTLVASLKVDTPITVLASQASKQHDLSKQLSTTISQQANEMLLSLAHEYVNSDWQTQVYQPYAQTLASYYPFNRSSDTDASVADVQAFFSTTGILNEFYNNRLKQFSTEANDQPFLPGLLPDTGLALSPDLWQMIDKADDIRQALFLADPNTVSVRFQLKAVEMSSSLTEFSIRSEKPIFSYQHGPTLWTEQQWLGENQIEDTLGMELLSQSDSIAKETYSGSWNWFRMIEPHVKSATAQSTQVEFTYGDNNVNLAIKTQGQINPFVPGFFSAFNLPNDL